MAYGICMGCFAVFHRPELAEGFAQLLATAVKVPTLFLLTLVVTFPSLYVFNALVGTRLTLRAMLRLLVASLAVNLAVLASLGPIVAFFSITTTTAGYGFMVLLNVLVFALSGTLGLTFLLQTLHRLSIARRWPTPLLSPTPGPGAPEGLNPPSVPSPPGPNVDPPVEAEMVHEPGALDRTEGYVLGRHVRKVFGCWVLVFGLVGAQMGWVLRPFVGSPAAPFRWFRERESSFFEAVLETIRNLF
jgi:hypothetical protein